MNKNNIIVIALLAAALTTFSCSKSMLEQRIDNSSEKNSQVENGIITITACLPEDDVRGIDSRVSIAEAGDYSAAILSWEEGDQITIVSTGTPVTATLGISSIDGKKATFTGPVPVGTVPYTIFYHRSKPLTLDRFDSITCDGQVQDGNGSTAHLQYGMKLVGVNAYESLTFSQEWATAHSEGGTGTISQNSVMQMLLKLPDSVNEVYSIYVHDDGSFKQTLWLKDGANMFVEPNSKDVVKAYMMVPDMDLASGNLTVRVETDNGAYEAAYPLNETDWVGGAQYTVQKNMSVLSVVTGERAAMEIHAKSAMDILRFKAGVIADNARFKASNVILEGDIDMSSAGSWTTSIPDTFTGTFGSVSALDKKTISGISATAPLFAAIPTGATVKNFELTGSFAFVQSAADYFGALAKTAQGVISGVTIGASVSVNIPGNDAINGLLDFGGMVGRVNNASAVIDHCCFDGTISVLSTYSNTNANGVRLGGLIGYITKQITISACSFEGVIRCEGEVSAAATDPTDAAKHPALSIGGIVGKLQNGTISACTTADADDALKPGITVNKTDYKGSIFVKSSTYNSVAVGGIAGFCYDGSASITGCSNATTILTNVTPTDAANVYLFSGGIVGFNRNNLTGCTNSGAQQHFTTSRLQSIGGIAGRQTGGTITVSTGITNSGDISVASEPVAASYQIAIGGVTGHSSIAIDGGSSNLVSNSGDITQSFNGLKNTSTANAANTGGLFLGGIVGYSTHAVSHASNSGDIEFVCNHTGTSSEVGGADLVHMGGIAGKVYASALEDMAYCSNSGKVTFDPTTTAPHSDGTKATYALYAHNYLGGIVGYGYLLNIKGDSTTKTTNSGNILGGDGSGNNNTGETFWVGGIAGRLEGASCSISYCNLTGSSVVKNNHWSNKSYSSYAPMCGGIAGEVLGVSANHATVSHCSIPNTANVVAVRGDMGGIVGYSRYGDFSDCSVARSFTGQSCYLIGGVIGWLRQGSVESSTFSGTQIKSSQLQYGGGIVGYLHAADVDGCTSAATEISKNGSAAPHGGIAGISAATSNIDNCHYKTAMGICPDANWTDGGHNVAE